MPVEENVEERWLRIGDLDGSHVIVGGGRDPFHDGYDFVDFPVTVSGDGLQAQATVRTIEGPSPIALTGFFQALADDWKGEHGEATWEAIEHGLSIVVSRDSFGHVLLTFELRESYRPHAWSAKVVVELEPGEEMSQVAQAVRRLLVTAPTSGA